MTNIQEILYRYLNLQLRLMVFSGARSSEGASRIKVRPVMLRDKLVFQCASTVGTKEFHENLERDAAVSRMEEWILRDFRQLQIDSEAGSVTVLVSKKGKVTVKEKSRKECDCGSPEAVEERKRQLSHNRKKRYILEEGKPVDFLVDLGVMTGEGKVVHARYDKFRQINRFLEFIEDILPRLDKGRELTILDFGCGKSYLTFAMYYYLHELRGYDIRIIGLDLKSEVVAHCGKLAEKYGYQKLAFLKGDIADYNGVDQVDMVVTLHACDTATDYALAKAVGWGAEVILSVPCCQHELNGQFADGGERSDGSSCLAPVMDYGILRERFAALATDGLRAKYLESMGYETQVLEFIDMEHTPKNILLREVKSGKRNDKAVKEIKKCTHFLGVTPTLGRLLGNKGENS